MSGQLRGRGAAIARRVAEHATGRAANPLESALRAIALDVPGLRVHAQVSIREPQFLGRVDLADGARRTVLEAAVAGRPQMTRRRHSAC